MFCGAEGIFVALSPSALPTTEDLSLNGAAATNPRRMLETWLSTCTDTLRVLAKDECLALSGSEAGVLAEWGFNGTSALLMPINSSAGLHAFLCVDISDVERLPAPQSLDSLRQLCHILGALISSSGEGAGHGTPDDDLQQQLTQSQQLLAESRLKQRELEALTRLKTQLYNSVLHDLRTPLAAFRGYVKIVLQDHVEGVETASKRFLKIALENANKLTQHLNRFARLSNGPKIRVESFDFRTLWTESLQLLRPQMDRKGLRVVERGSAGPIEVMGDRQKLWLVIYRLLADAVRSTNDGGHILGEFELREDQIKIRISTRGEPISAEVGECAATSVGPTHELSDQEAGDTGFSAAQDTIWLHGGTISVANGSGCGSCYSLTLPIFPKNDFDGGAGGE
jgi:signal transduction histidine kinase